MDQYYIIYKERVLAGPLLKDDAEQKRIKLGHCFQNVLVVHESEVKIKDAADEAGSHPEAELE